MLYVSYFFSKNGNTGFGKAVNSLKGKITPNKLEEIRESLKNENNFKECVILFFRELDEEEGYE